MLKSQFGLLWDFFPCAGIETWISESVSPALHLVGGAHGGQPLLAAGLRKTEAGACSCWLGGDLHLWPLATGWTKDFRFWS